MTRNTNSTLKLCSLAFGALLCAALSGCNASPGRCVGASDLSTSGDNVLLNLDRQGVAIEGYDPVAYFTDSKPVKGDAKWRSTFNGAAYHFASAEHKRLFDASPEKYAPQFGGYCAYAASIDAISPIDPAYWEIVDGRLILQHNKKAWDLWHKDPAQNLVKADKNWPGLVDRNGAPSRALINVDEQGLALEGYDPVSYFTAGNPIKGDPALARSFQGATYYFVSNDSKNTFEKNPAQYVPAFGGFCGYAASINKVSPVNPEIWQLVDGRLVLQHTPKAFELFNEDVPGNYARANKNWPGLSHRRCN
jgi:YHS domain-containing protein